MPKLRAKNDRSGIADLGEHHFYKAPRIPNPRTARAEDYCRTHHNLKVSLLSNEAAVRSAAKSLALRQSQSNIERLNVAKGRFSETKEIMLSHIMECEMCE